MSRFTINLYFPDSESTGEYLSVETDYVPSKGDIVYITSTVTQYNTPYKVVSIDCVLTQRQGNFYSARPEVHLIRLTARERKGK